MSDPEEFHIVTESEGYKAIAEQLWKAVQLGPEKDWRMPWHYVAQRPANPVNGSLFNGVNVLILSSAAHAFKFESHEWATPKTWRRVGGRVMDLNAGIKIFRPVFDENAAKQTLTWTPNTPGIKRLVGPLGPAAIGGTINRQPMIGWEFTKVYNIANVRGRNLPRSSKPHPWHPIDAAERVLSGWRACGGPQIRRDGTKAFWAPSTDCITMPPNEAFPRYQGLEGSHYRYAVEIHEHIHAAGAVSRLNRPTLKDYSKSKENRATEELIAEIGASFLGSTLGLSTRLRPDHTIYVEDWLAAIAQEKQQKHFLYAVTQADIASRYILQECGVTLTNSSTER